MSTRTVSGADPFVSNAVRGGAGSAAGVGPAARNENFQPVGPLPVVVTPRAVAVYACADSFTAESEPRRIPGGRPGEAFLMARSKQALRRGTKTHLSPAHFPRRDGPEPLREKIDQHARGTGLGTTPLTEAAPDGRATALGRSVLPQPEKPRRIAVYTGAQKRRGISGARAALDLPVGWRSPRPFRGCGNATHVD